ncbi:hypothetical protein [Cystobacter ferrugineus]|uniref:Secreted protein n=1 Tax=Cystobacter ferrugineus TaxID=83449 RepID=A0A1L9BJV9_9BACT|nr:hypothetical protein [Cystobacter ferrugineus]OJH42509.1 hypothetical protein BON30_04765 [Cystobacter ferrugineus]
MSPSHGAALLALFGLLALTNGAAACPTQSALASNARCGVEYGAYIQFTYTNAAMWWFKERVVQGEPNECQPGTIDQTINPFQSRSGTIIDDVSNTNGPPGPLAPCRDLTQQTIFTGPTQSTVEQCPYYNGQLIQVTKTPAQVATSSDGATATCNY